MQVSRGGGGALGRSAPGGLLVGRGLLLAGPWVVALLLASPARALDASEAKGRAQLAIQEAQSEIPGLRAQSVRGAHRRYNVPHRVASGELLLRIGDFDRAIDELNELLELQRQGKVGASAHADSLYLLGESYFRDDQFLAAQRHYRELVKLGDRSPYSRYSGQALGRLVDIALRTGDLSKLDFVFERMSQLQSIDSAGYLEYARGKAYFARQDYANATGALNQVGANTPVHHQAQYLLGVVQLKQALSQATGEGAPRRFSAVVAQFRRVTRLPADNSDHRHVIDLAWMAIGRLLYEQENYLDAAEAYSHVDRTSPEFGEMLYELAWVYVRLGDYQRAQRALEVLSITAPENLQFADGSLLRADLKLRSGQFKGALELYENVRERFDPVREQVDGFLTSTTDPAVYYDRLLEDPLVSGPRDALPEVVITWVREAAEDDKVFSVVDQVSRSRNLIRRSRQLASRLGALLASDARVKAFPELKQNMERALGVANKIADAYRVLALGMEDVEDDSLSGEIGQVRQERRSLMKRMSWLPITPGDFLRREQSGQRQWNAVSQKLQRLTLEIDRLQAIVNALRRVLREHDRHGVTADAESLARFRAEVEANERDLEVYRRRLDGYREAIENGRVQIGFGDQRYIEDARVRERFRQVFSRELELAQAGQGGEDLSAYARSVRPVVDKARGAEASLEAILAGLRAQVAEQATEVHAVVDKESQNIQRYAEQLDALDQHARLLVGEVAMRNFGLVRDRLKNIVLRADVGIVQQAWEIREEQLHRVRELQRERALEEQNLNDELREVLDDAEGAL